MVLNIVIIRLKLRRQVSLMIMGCSLIKSVLALFKTLQMVFKAILVFGQSIVWIVDGENVAP